MKIKQITRVSLYAAFIAVSVYLIPPLQIPSIQVPFTLQTMLIMLAGYLFVPKEAFLTVFIYVFIGAIGLPVYSGGRGGFSVLFGPTGGFLLLFPFVSFFISFFKSKTKRKLFDLGIGFAFGIVSLFLLGAIWLSVSLSIGYISALLSLLPFVPFDILKLLLAYLIYLKFPKDLI